MADGLRRLEAPGMNDTDPAVDPGKARPVLVVDDDPLICAVVERVLVRAGRTVRTCPDAASALAEFSLSGDPIGMLITDVSMPGELDGIALAGLIAERCPRLPIVIMSGDAGSLVRGGEQAGVAATLAKPFTLDELGDVVELVSRR